MRLKFKDEIGTIAEYGTFLSKKRKWTQEENGDLRKKEVQLTTEMLVTSWSFYV